MIPEILILQHLENRLSVPVALQVSPDLKDCPKYVILQRIGGEVNDHIRSVTFTVQSIAPSLLEACKLNEEVKEAMESLIESEHVSRIDLDSDYEYTDTATKRFRYQAVYNLWLFD